MTIQEFQKVFPIPEKPVETGNPKSWATYEKQLAVKLPSDYKEFIENYGTGCISMFLWIFNPFSKNKNLDLIPQVKKISSQYQSQKEEMGEEACPYPVYPKSGGLIPFGITDNGDVFFWLSESKNPDQWPIVVNRVRSNDYETHEKKLTGFLAGIVQGKIKSKIFTPEFIDKDKLFLPANKVEY